MTACPACASAECICHLPASVRAIIEETDRQRANDPEPMHTWFSLTYSSYLVLQRSAIQTMPREWQVRLVALLDEMEGTLDTSECPSEFMVRARKNGKFVKDPWRDYQRGRYRVPLRKGGAL